MTTTTKTIRFFSGKAKDLDVDKLIDNSVVKELEDSGFIKQIYSA